MINTLEKNAPVKLDWRSKPADNLQQLRAKLIYKYGSLTRASKILKILYPRLSNALGGREQTINVIATIQQDMELSDSQILNLWPLLREWPRESRRVG